MNNSSVNILPPFTLISKSNIIVNYYQRPVRLQNFTFLTFPKHPIGFLCAFDLNLSYTTDIHVAIVILPEILRCWWSNWMLGKEEKLHLLKDVFYN